MVDDLSRRKWRVTYRTVSGGRFVRLWPANYAKDEATARRVFGARTLLLQAHGVDSGSPRGVVKRAEGTKVAKVERSTRFSG